METSAKNILFIAIAVIAAFLVVYGSVLLLSPAYRDNLKKRPMNRPKRIGRILDKIGSFDLEPGKGISYEESGQPYSEYASGQNPNLKGSYDVVVEKPNDQQGEEDFFNMFQQ